MIKWKNYSIKFGIVLEMMDAISMASLKDLEPNLLIF